MLVLALRRRLQTEPRSLDLPSGKTEPFHSGCDRVRECPEGVESHLCLSSCGADVGGAESGNPGLPRGKEQPFHGGCDCIQTELGGVAGRRCSDRSIQYFGSWTAGFRGVDVGRVAGLLAYESLIARRWTPSRGDRRAASS